MRTRIYLRTTKGAEERHIDYEPATKKHPSTAHIATDGSFTVPVEELRQAVRVLTLLDTPEERDC